MCIFKHAYMHIFIYEYIHKHLLNKNNNQQQNFVVFKYKIFSLKQKIPRDIKFFAKFG